MVDRTGVRLLIDVANLHTERVNHGVDPAAALAALPLEAVEYVHVAGGVERDGLWHDTHAHPVSAPILEVLGTLCALRRPPRVLLERDADFPSAGELAGELAAIRDAVEAAPAAVAAVAGRARPSGATRPEPARARAELASAQTHLLAALVAGGPTPAGFDVDRVRVQSRALAAKRREAAVRAVPELATTLGARWPGEFMAWAMVHPKPAQGGTRADAFAFAQHLWDADRLPRALGSAFVTRSPSRRRWLRTLRRNRAASV